ncbi:MAG TPA: DinB family protein [Thermoanaerobaculia bacterium]|nr:DinB family protein [Thermoanaerobaculia bacterium]
MTTAVPETLSEVELIRHQTQMTHAVVKLNIAGLTQEESLIQPTAGNCANWVLGHILGTYCGGLELLGQEPPMTKETLKHYDRGAEPIRDAAEALDFQEMATVLDEAVRRFDAGLSSLTPEVLDRPMPNSPTKNPNETVRSLLSTISFHQAYHAGQLGLLRRIAGKEGAIR